MYVNKDPTISFTMNGIESETASFISPLNGGEGKIAVSAKPCSLFESNAR